MKGRQWPSSSSAVHTHRSHQDVQTDREAGRQAGRQAFRQADGQTDIHTTHSHSSSGSSKVHPNGSSSVGVQIECPARSEAVGRTAAQPPVNVSEDWLAGTRRATGKLSRISRIAWILSLQKRRLTRSTDQATKQPTDQSTNKRTK